MKKTLYIFNLSLTVVIFMMLLSLLHDQYKVKSCLSEIKKQNIVITELLIEPLLPEWEDKTEAAKSLEPLKY
jgi:hypothetical protein